MESVFLSPAALAAFIATGVISLAPNIIFLLMPNFAAGESSLWLSLGQALAAGGLLGDVFLHTLDEQHSSNNESSGIWVLTGFTIFLIADLFIRTFHQHNGHTHHHNHNHGEHSKENGSTNNNNKENCGGGEVVQINRSVIVLNLAADALHNYTDGLAIGASYSMPTSSASTSAWSMLLSHTRGGLATLAIFFHEVPHELGDFCTLVRAGYSAKEAILAQLGTAVAAFAGAATAVAVSSEEWAELRLLWITAGGFVYLAATTILPEVLAEDHNNYNNSNKNNKNSSAVMFRLAQLAAFCSGIFFLYLVALMEEADASGEDGGHHHHHHHHHDVHEHDQNQHLHHDDAGHEHHHHHHGEL